MREVGELTHHCAKTLPHISQLQINAERNTLAAIELRAALINQHLETMRQILTGNALLLLYSALNEQFDRLLCLANKRLSVRGMKTRVRACERAGA